MKKKYQDALAIMRAFQSKPDIFLTITANADWPEITREVQKCPGLENKDRDGIIARVFQGKLKELLDDILNKHVLGVIVAHVYVIEFQKRGLPHAHMLLILHPECKLDNPALYDQLITAEIPDPQRYPLAHELFAKFQMHGPCQYYGNCLNHNGYCTKYFPKQFEEKTINSNDGYARYRRRAPGKGGFECKTQHSGDDWVDNRYAIPTNLGLLLKYRCHINIEYCATIQSIKYVYKYIYKGSDKAYIALQKAKKQQQNNRNEQKTEYVRECDDFIECSYFGAAEAHWKINKFKMGNQKPKVKALPVHLQAEQPIHFPETGVYPEHIEDENNYVTPLTAYFDNNLKEINDPLPPSKLGKFHDGTIRPAGPELMYHEMPQFYEWKKNDWHRRTPHANRLQPTISRIHYVNYKQSERYYLRLLLLKRPGATKFSDLRKMDMRNEIEKPMATYKEACEKLGFLDDDTEFHQCMDEATDIVGTPYNLRQLFATILNNNHLVSPKKLWNKFKEAMTLDIKYEYYRFKKNQTETQNQNIPMNMRYYDKEDEKFTQHMFNEALFRIELMLDPVPEGKGESKLQDHRLPTPNPNHRIDIPTISNIERDEKFDPTVEAESAAKKVKLMNTKQNIAYKSVLASVYPNKSEFKGWQTKNKFFFIQASAGTGKTFLLKTIASAIRANGDICLCNATSGIAATLFEGGQTMHCRFQIPLDVNRNSGLTISKNSIEADLIRKSKCIIWDEAPMGHKHMLLWLNRQLKDICGSEELFGGKVLVLSGDFQQIPPVVPKASTNVIINSSIKRCKLFKDAYILKLTTNERLRRLFRIYKTLSQKQIDRYNSFKTWIEKMGSNNLDPYKHIDKYAIRIPKQYMSTSKTRQQMIDEMYEDMNAYSERTKYFLERCILCPLNKSVDKINELCFDKITGQEEKLYKSIDSVGLDDCSSLFDEGFLNTRNFPGIPPHKLRLKTNVPIMLLRNIDPRSGLCNGTRLLIKKLHKYVLECVKLTDKETRIFIPKMTLSPTNLKLGYEFRRRQFPVRLAFAMTINKSQGQTLQKTMIYLPQAVFEHGQLYVAASRVTTPKNLKIFIEENKFQGKRRDKNNKEWWYTRNIVHPQLLM